MLERYFKLILGLFLIAASKVITINASLGYPPWDVFHQGIANILNIKIGTVIIIVGVIIVGIGILFGQRPGIGTILNMFLIGVFINIIMTIKLMPVFANVYIRLLTVFISMIIMGLGSYLYIGAGFGAGPRDGLMLILLEKTNKSVSFIRNSIEIMVLVIGYLLGGPVGVGTVIVSLGLGFAIQFVFNLFKFDPNTIDHRGWDDEVASLKRFLSSSNE